jgi:hypothetical protein
VANVPGRARLVEERELAAGLSFLSSALSLRKGRKVSGKEGRGGLYLGDFGMSARLTVSAYALTGFEKQIR